MAPAWFHFRTLGGGHSYTASWVDIDRDGLLDLFVANGGMSHAGPNGLYRGTGEGHFEKVTEGEIVTEAASTCGIAWGDYDNEGDLDAIVANWGAGAEAYLNDGRGKFERAPSGFLGTDIWYVGAMASGDFDGDGNLDVFVGNWPNNPGPGELNWLFRNGDTDGHWLRVKLVGPAGHPGGVGARVLVTTEGLTQMGFRGQSDTSPHFGLGQYDSASIVEVRWPSGGVSILENVAADQFVKITETPPSP